MTVPPTSKWRFSPSARISARAGEERNAWRTICFIGVASIGIRENDRAMRVACRCVGALLHTPELLEEVTGAQKVETEFRHLQPDLLLRAAQESRCGIQRMSALPLIFQVRKVPLRPWLSP